MNPVQQDSIEMEYRRLGRTGLNVSVLSLGTGGVNRFGQSRHVSRKAIHRLVRTALDLGVNFFDTSGAYEHSEAVLGEALRGVPRDSYYVATKVFPLNQQGVIGPAEARRLVERSLQQLEVDELDLLQLHRVMPETYTETRDRLIPELQRLRAEGKVRYIGITESSSRDPLHRMLRSALQDNLFDTVMVAFHLANTTADQEVFPLALANDTGVIGMTVARHQVPRSLAERLNILSGSMAGLVMSPPKWGQLKVRLRKSLSAAVRSGPRPGPPIIRTGAGCPLQLPEATYTFALSQPATATVLTGTTDLVHLRRNVAAALAPALTEVEISQLLERANGASSRPLR